jgi:hypothetical protein
LRTFPRTANFPPSYRFLTVFPLESKFSKSRAFRAFEQKSKTICQKMK